MPPVSMPVTYGSLSSYISGCPYCGSAGGAPVSVCGETAADPRLVPLYMSYGIASFSVSAVAVPRVRKAVSLWSKAEADSLAKAVGRLGTAKEVRELLDSSQRT